MWDCPKVEIESSMTFYHALVVHGRFIKSGNEFSLVNVYAPCDS